ncbi:MAG: hypothetical protein HC819_17400 [Cyclobacteriaceae bacterium]|nr:hypothetical protein [Cyclobacteriaceae bacterium]
MNRIVIAKKILLWVVLAFVGLVAAGILFSYIYKDDIIGYFVNETNKHITTPIDVGKIEVSFLSNFPSVSINLHNVTIKESTGEHLGVLGKAKIISISFNPILLLQQDYTISRIFMADGEVNLKIDQDGLPNYLFLKKMAMQKAMVNCLCKT